MSADRTNSAVHKPSALERLLASAPPAPTRSALQRILDELPPVRLNTVRLTTLADLVATMPPVPEEGAALRRILEGK